MSSRLQKTAVRLKPEEEERRAKIWDNEHGCWKILEVEKLEAADKQFGIGRRQHATTREGHTISVVGKTFFDNLPCERLECTCGWRGEWIRKLR